MNEKKFVLVLGGSRSGKSEFAEQTAAAMGGPVTYIATLTAGDEEMSRRVAAHRERRPTGWATVEESQDVPLRVREAGIKSGTILIDCLTGWLSNLLLDGSLPCPGASSREKEDYIMSRVEDLAAAVADSRASVLVVSSEVGMGLVPSYPLGRAFRDIAGSANRRMASAADEVYLVVAGLAVEIRSLAVNLESRN
ncbi:MAG: bifunctional adenosylcobinamide kinase/adenosylcobinamide-phosphate guanylyltransferase [Desulfocucumaceae bacterium]